MQTCLYNYKLSLAWQFREKGKKKYEKEFSFIQIYIYIYVWNQQPQTTVDSHIIYLASYSYHKFQKCFNVVGIVCKYETVLSETPSSNLYYYGASIIQLLVCLVYIQFIRCLKCFSNKNCLVYIQFIRCLKCFSNKKASSIFE